MGTEYYYKNKQICLAKHSEYKFKKLYGITKAQKEEIRLKQNNKCLICDNEFIRSHKSIRACCTDHDHNIKNSNYRGLICGKCNRGLGLFRDSVQSLLKAVKYLKENKPIIGV